MSRLDRGLHGPDEFGGDHIQIDIVANPVGKCRDRCLGIVSGPIEGTIHHPLDPPAQGIEQGDSHQGIDEQGSPRSMPGGDEQGHGRYRRQPQPAAPG